MNITFINRMMGIKFGGGENFDLNMARALKKRGHNIRFIVGREWQQLSLPMNTDEFEVIYIKTPYLRDFHYQIKPTNLFSKLISVSALEFDLWLFENSVIKYLKHDKWSDIYQICGLPRLGAILSDQKGSLNHQFKIAVRWPGPPPKRKLKSMRKCDINFANGDAFRLIKKTLLPEIHEVNLGIDIEKFHPIPKKEKNIIEFLFVGRIIPIKNLSFMIKGFLTALETNPNMILNIVGDGEISELNKVQELSKNTPKIKFLGNKHADELVSLYQQSDIFIITSTYDNYPNVIFEAMASGIPVIGTKVGGIPIQVVHQETGLLIESNNLEQLKNAILELSNNQVKRATMSKQSRAKIEKEFSWDKSAEQLEKLYKAIG